MHSGNIHVNTRDWQMEGTQKWMTGMATTPLHTLLTGYSVNYNVADTES